MTFSYDYLLVVGPLVGDMDGLNPVREEVNMVACTTVDGFALEMNDSDTPSFRSCVVKVVAN